MTLLARTPESATKKARSRQSTSGQTTINFIAYKGEAGAKEAGKMRAEGKEYVVKDGDVLNFLFNV